MQAPAKAPRRDAYDHHPFEENCGAHAACTSIFTCPFNECVGEAKARDLHRDEMTQRVLQLRQQGHSHQSIAIQLKISIRTVYRYIYLERNNRY